MDPQIVARLGSLAAYLASQGWVVAMDNGPNMTCKELVSLLYLVGATIIDSLFIITLLHLTSLQ